MGHLHPVPAAGVWDFLPPDGGDDHPLPGVDDLVEFARNWQPRPRALGPALPRGRRQRCRARTTVTLAGLLRLDHRSLRRERTGRRGRGAPAGRRPAARGRAARGGDDPRTDLRPVDHRRAAPWLPAAGDGTQCAAAADAVRGPGTGARVAAQAGRSSAGRGVPRPLPAHVHVGGGRRVVRTSRT